MGRLVTDDLEFFFHHRWGPIARSREEFVQIIRGNCERQAVGSDPRARRESVPETIFAYPIKGYEALETGSHRCYQMRPDGEVPTEHAKFVQLRHQVDLQRPSYPSGSSPTRSS